MWCDTRGVMLKKTYTYTIRFKLDFCHYIALRSSAIAMSINVCRGYVLLRDS